MAVDGEPANGDKKCPGNNVRTGSRYGMAFESCVIVIDDCAAYDPSEFMKRMRNHGPTIEHLRGWGIDSAKQGKTAIPRLLYGPWEGDRVGRRSFESTTYVVNRTMLPLGKDSAGRGSLSTATDAVALPRRCGF